MTLSIEVPRAYDLLSSVHAWVYPDIQPVPEVTWSEGFGRVFTFNEIQAPVIVLQESPGNKLRLQYDNVDVRASSIRSKIRRVLSLDVDTSSAMKHIIEDPVVCSVGPAVEKIRPYCTDTILEALIKAILQQQVSYRAASILTKRMIVGLVTPTEFKMRHLYSFPSALTLVNAGRPRLSDFGFGFKTDYVYDVASAANTGMLNVEVLSGRTSADAREMLQSFRGIGNWTIDALAISGLGDFSVFPSGDLGMRNLLGRLYNKGIRVSQAQVVKKIESWGTDGPLVLYLLMCADVLGMLGQSGRPKTHKREPLKAQSES
ncbi:MAG: hypothetical protein C4K47_09875 [Candidatus Thorarchaeota archaeon]|nr:MAG: hypothetical protein C4K47_09875 [Candidatus Thorarchaeota archaeon]